MVPLRDLCPCCALGVHLLCPCCALAAPFLCICTALGVPLLCLCCALFVYSCCALLAIITTFLYINTPSRGHGANLFALVLEKISIFKILKSLIYHVLLLIS